MTEKPDTNVPDITSTPIVITLGNESRQVVEVEGEAIDDADEFEDPEIVRRRLAVWPAFCSKLSVEVFEESGRRPYDASS